MMGTSDQVLVFNKNDDHDGSNWLSQHEFLEKELTTLLVLQHMFRSICIYSILNIMHVNLYFSQIFYVKNKWQCS